MAKFNVVQKQRRALIAEKKRQLHGDPSTGKLKVKDQPHSLSGKRKRKLFKKWRRDQKEAMQKGLVSMEDVQMAVAESGETKEDSTSSGKSSGKIHLKKSLKLKQLKHKAVPWCHGGFLADCHELPCYCELCIRPSGKNKRKSNVPAADSSADAMVE